MTSGTGRLVVRIRLRGHAYTSGPKSPADAVALRDSYRRALMNIGDGPDLINITDRNGREVDIRARDVVVVELGPDGPEDPVGEARRRDRRQYSRAQGARVTSIDGGPALPPGTYQAPDGSTLTVTEGSTGEEATEFLRRVAAADGGLVGSVARHPAGSRR